MNYKKLTFLCLCLREKVHLCGCRGRTQLLFLNFCLGYENELGISIQYQYHLSLVYTSDVSTSAKHTYIQQFLFHHGNGLDADISKRILNSFFLFLALRL